MVLGVGEYSIYTLLVVVLCVLCTDRHFPAEFAELLHRGKSFSVNVNGFDGVLLPAVRRY
jgi:hypothetical protein